MNTWSKVATVAAALAVGVLGLSATSSGAPSRDVRAVAPASVPRAPLAVAPQLAPETHLVTITPCRIVDTRKAGGSLGSGAHRSVYVGGAVGFTGQGGHGGGCGIPTGATALAANLVVIKKAGHTGYVKGYPYATAEPGAAALNYNSPAGVTSSGVTIPIKPGGGPSLTLANVGARVSVVIDVAGYYIPAIQALIGASGTIDAGTARIVSTSHAGTGFYYITLDRPARQCAPAAVTYNYGHYASVGLSSSSTPNTISVLTWNLNTAGTAVLTDESFFLSVTC